MSTRIENHEYWDTELRILGYRITNTRIQNYERIREPRITRIQNYE